MCTLTRRNARWRVFHSAVGASSHLGSQNQHPKRLHEDRGREPSSQRRGLSRRKGLELHLGVKSFCECLEQSGASGKGKGRGRGPFSISEPHHPNFRFPGERL